MKFQWLRKAINQVAFVPMPLTTGMGERQPDLQRLLTKCSDLCADLRCINDRDLHCQTDMMRRELLAANKTSLDFTHGTSSHPWQYEQIVLAAACVAESVRRCFKIELFETQLTAGIAMCLENVAEMATGEGKTFAGLIPTFYFALFGRGVHVCLSNSYLATRDHELLSQPLQKLGVDAALRGQEDSLSQTQQAYFADVTYGPGHVFGFDYLRDQCSRRQEAKSPVGSQTLNQISGKGVEQRMRQRGLHAAVIDEIDQVLVDDAMSPMIITDAGKAVAADGQIHLAARELSVKLVKRIHYYIESNTAIHLTEQGFREIYQGNPYSTDQRLCRPWHDYVLAALKAQHLLLCDKHYVVRDETVRLVEQSTGRIFPDRNWRGGLQQAVQAKERLPVTAESVPQGQITRQAFYRRYGRICGMTGTAKSCREELRAVYRLRLHRIPTIQPCRREIYPLGVYSSIHEKLKGLIDEVQQMIDSQRCILIGTNHIDQSRWISNALDGRSIPHQILNGVQSESEANIIARSGGSRCVTVATHLAGRGTDIRLEPIAAVQGGLHVIGWEHHPLQRVDRQLVGRCARQGDPGSARFYLSPDDQFVCRHASFLKPAIRRYLDSRSSLPTLARAIRSVQKQYEATQKGIRLQMMVKSNRLI